MTLCGVGADVSAAVAWGASVFPVAGGIGVVDDGLEDDASVPSYFDAAAVAEACKAVRLDTERPSLGGGDGGEWEVCCWYADGGGAAGIGL